MERQIGVNRLRKDLQPLRLEVPPNEACSSLSCPNPCPSCSIERAQRMRRFLFSFDSFSSRQAPFSTVLPKPDEMSLKKRDQGPGTSFEAE